MYGEPKVKSEGVIRFVNLKVAEQACLRNIGWPHLSSYTYQVDVHFVLRLNPFSNSSDGKNRSWFDASILYTYQPPGSLKYQVLTLA